MLCNIVIIYNMNINRFLLPVSTDLSDEEKTYILYIDKQKYEIEKKNNNSDYLKHFIDAPEIIVRVVKDKLIQYNLNFSVALFRYGNTTFNYNDVELLYGESIGDIFAKYVINKIFYSYKSLNRKNRWYNKKDNTYLVTIIL